MNVYRLMFICGIVGALLSTFMSNDETTNEEDD